MGEYDDVSRRGFLKGSAAAAGAGALSLLPLQIALAAAFPERPISVIVPTQQGGGADRLLRAFTNVWKKYLKTNFDPSFVPAASGRAGYEQFMGKRAADGYNLLFGNMGPEVLNWVVQKPTFNLADFTYFLQVDADPSSAFVSGKSKFKTIDDIVTEGRKRTMTVATSRLAHPASIGILLLGEKLGIRFNLVPFSGGRNTIAAVTTGEVDFGVLPLGGHPGGEVTKTVLLFARENKLPQRSHNAPTMNAHFKMDTPSLNSARAFGIHASVVDKYPDRFKVLTETANQVFKDPELAVEMKKGNQDLDLLSFGGIKECQEYSKQIAAIGERFKPLLTGGGGGKKKKG